MKAQFFGGIDIQDELRNKDFDEENIKKIWLINNQKFVLQEFKNLDGSLRYECPIEEEYKYIGRKKFTCGECGGDGEIDCPHCEGTGRIECEECYGVGYNEKKVSEFIKKQIDKKTEKFDNQVELF